MPAVDGHCLRLVRLWAGFGVWLLRRRGVIEWGSFISTYDSCDYSFFSVVGFSERGAIWSEPAWGACQSFSGIPVSAARGPLFRRFHDDRDYLNSCTYKP